MESAAQLKARLAHTWPVFFARHGNFTSAQLQAIAPILDGRNTLLIAATAAGKTEAAVAPLVEQLLLREDVLPTQPELRILYICPTRALVRDLYERIALPLGELQVPLAMKSGDTGLLSAGRPPSVLITTPESTDSLLTRSPRLLGALHAVILDEVHLLDGGVRGDHVRCLLRRIEHIRRYRQQEVSDAPRVPMQRVALSATVSDPEAVAERYLSDVDGGDAPVIVQVPGVRRINANFAPMAGLGDLAQALVLRMTGQTGVRKALLFCNSRKEVEEVAAYLRSHFPVEAPIFVHYSNLDPKMRRQVEDRFAEASTALCVCTSTLELGIDIGSIDDVVLIGPPPTAMGFLQRIGRGGRRGDTTRVLGLYRSELELVRFQALLAMAESGRVDVAPVSSHAMSVVLPAARQTFRLAVLVQQVFSILKQSPTGAMRLADLQRAAPVRIDEEVLRRLLRHLVREGYLKPGRPGEWRAGPALEELVDAHEIYSNIGAEPLAVTVVDAYTFEVIAQAERGRHVGETLILRGQWMEVVWRDRYRMGVRARAGAMPVEELRVRTPPFAVSLAVSQEVGRLLGVPPGQLWMLSDEERCWLFHFWGDVYGELLAAILRIEAESWHEHASVERQNEHCIRISTPFAQLPPWDEVLVGRELRALVPQIEPFLECGRFHPLLPPDLADRVVVEQFDLARFETLYRHARVSPAPATVRSRLLTLVQ
jgi:ATP-dependent Lhr-like helicase